MKCRNCGQPATANYQKLWARWDYDPETDEYSRDHTLLVDPIPDSDENLYLCHECAEEWESGKLAL